MKVLINGLQLSNINSGVQYYTQHLYSAIKEIQSCNIETHLYQRSKNHRSPFSIFSFMNRVSAFSHFLSHQKCRLLRIINENFSLLNYIKNNNFDLYHSPNYILPFFLKSPSVVTVHDLITFDFPKLCQTTSVIYFRLFLSRSIKKAKKIITVSETTKKDIVNRFKIPENKIAVIHLGVSATFQRTISRELLTKHHIVKKYILFVGNIEPKKNLVRILEAYCNLIHTKNITHQLVIAGKRGWKYKEVFRTVHMLELQDKVIFTGYVPEKDLAALYSMADLFVFPSIYEGFGIPPLEAMACETPVIVSNLGALPETTGGNCLMVDPYNIDDIADGMYKLLTNEKLRGEYITKGKDWVQQFTWERTARKTLEVYEEVGKMYRESEKQYSRLFI